MVNTYMYYFPFYFLRYIWHSPGHAAAPAISPPPLLLLEETDQTDPEAVKTDQTDPEADQTDPKASQADERKE